MEYIYVRFYTGIILEKWKKFLKNIQNLLETFSSFKLSTVEFFYDTERFLLPNWDSNIYRFKDSQFNYLRALTTRDATCN